MITNDIVDKLLSGIKLFSKYLFKAIIAYFLLYTHNVLFNTYIRVAGSKSLILSQSNFNTN